jgi:hypothetical protein
MELRKQKGKFCHWCHQPMCTHRQAHNLIDLTAH